MKLVEQDATGKIISVKCVSEISSIKSLSSEERFVYNVLNALISQRAYTDERTAEEIAFFTKLPMATVRKSIQTLKDSGKLIRKTEYGYTYWTTRWMIDHPDFREWTEYTF